MTEREFEHIYLSIRRKLLALIKRFAKASAMDIDADDILQEAMITLWELSQQGYPIQNAEALLVRITKVACISRMRRRKIECASIEGDNYYGGESASERVDKMDQQMLKKKLYECLTQTELTYMKMKMEQGLSLDEISQRTGSPKPGIYTALSKAKKKLKEQFKKIGYGK